MRAFIPVLVSRLIAQMLKHLGSEIWSVDSCSSGAPVWVAGSEGRAWGPRPYLRGVEYRSVGNANGVLFSDIL